jgi:hypothetical protein
MKIKIKKTKENKMKKQVVSVFAVFIASAAIFVGSNAKAQTVVFSPSFFYKTFTEDFERENGSTIEVSSTETYYDIKLGVLLSNNIYVGAVYAQMNSEAEVNGSDGEQIRTSYGASVGYMSQGWFVIGHYFLASEYEYSETFTFQGGSGFQFDFGYLFDIGSNFSIGPQISYKTFTYTELDNDGNSEDLKKGSSSDLLPFVTVAVKF